MAKLYILSDSALEELKSENSIKSNLKCYQSGGEFILENGQLKELKDCSIPNDLCSRLLESNSDYEAAICLHSSLNISPLLASDEHLWAYLSHGPLLKYVQQRWSVDVVENFITHIHEHWFVNGQARIMRNALASLWWSVEISKVEEDNPYRLTKILFSNYTLRVVSLAQVLRSRNVLRGILEWFDKNGTDNMEVRGAFIAKYLNQLASIKQLTILDYREIVVLINEVKDVIMNIKDKKDYQNISVSDVIFNKRNPTN
jgi:hypothetical protein